MPLQDWIHRYPKVQALLQGDEALLYGVEDETTLEFLDPPATTVISSEALVDFLAARDLAAAREAYVCTVNQSTVRLEESVRRLGLGREPME